MFPYVSCTYVTFAYADLACNEGLQCNDGVGRLFYCFFNVPSVPMTTRVALLGGKWTCKRQQSFNRLCNYFSSIQVADSYTIMI